MQANKYTVLIFYLLFYSVLKVTNICDEKFAIKKSDKF